MLRKAPTTACRRSSFDSWARVLATRARQCGAYSPCPRLAAQPQLVYLPLYPIVCLGSCTLASTAPFAASCPAPQSSSQRAPLDPLVLAAAELSAQELSQRDPSSSRPLDLDERRSASCGATRIYRVIHRVRHVGPRADGNNLDFVWACLSRESFKRCQLYVRRDVFTHLLTQLLKASAQTRIPTSPTSTVDVDAAIDDDKSTASLAVSARPAHILRTGGALIYIYMT